MTLELLERPQPLVLVVEDDAESLDLRIDLFQSFGCAAIGARSRREALRELRATPMVDLLVTDINMPEDGNREDKSGIELAVEVRETYPRLPIAGYSAVFAENSFSERELETFDVAFPKGRQSIAALRKQVQECVTLAEDHREARLALAEQELDRLRRDHEIAVPAAEVVRRLSPDGGAVVEAALQRAGYSLRLVTSSSEGSLREPFAVWLIETTEGWEGEVYAYPELYALGSTDDEVVGSILELMVLLHEDLRESPGPNSAQVARLATFLDRVLGQEGA